MDKILDIFQNEEQGKRQTINELMENWKKEVSKSKVLFREDNKLYSGDKYFTADGFFPNYYNQPPKILFIGREPRGISGEDLIERILNSFKNNVSLGSFWRRILYILYGIKTSGTVEFQNKPHFKNIAKMVVESSVYGFSIMNYSKYSNDCEDGASADINLMNNFFENSHLEKRNFLKEELEILDPEIIITSNLWDGKIREEYLNYMFENTTFVKNDSGVANLSTMELNGKKIKIIDLYHFSRPGVGDKDYYYDPVINLLFK
jgi:hypothetical protein